jgi:hypothetical protein
LQGIPVGEEQQQHEFHNSPNQLNMTNSNQPKIGQLLREHENNVKALKAICTDSIPVMYLVEWVQKHEPFIITADSWQDCPELSPSQVNQLLTPDCRSMTMAEIKVMQDKKNTVINKIIKFEHAMYDVCREDSGDPMVPDVHLVPTDAQLTNLNRLYMNLFYYDTQMDNLMTTKYRREIEHDIARFFPIGAPFDTTKYPFLNPDVYSAEKAIKIAKNEETSRRLKTNTAVSVFMEHCSQAVPELTRTTMEFVGNTGYTQYTPDYIMETVVDTEDWFPIYTSAIGG